MGLHDIEDGCGECRRLAPHGKPAVVDEIGDEGDLDWGWGNLSAQELVRRDFDAVWGGEDGYRILYFGPSRPRFRTINLPSGCWDVDVINTWEMTIETPFTEAEGTIVVDLAAREYVAVRPLLLIIITLRRLRVPMAAGGDPTG